MGRVKLAIKKIGSGSGRQSTYGKRKNGLFKKASELSILCDIDILLLMFSPTGRPTLYTGESSTLEEIIGRFSQLTPQERAKRKLESLEALKRTYRKSDHDLNIQEFMGPCYQSVEDMTAEANVLQTQLSEVRKKLSYWTNIDKIDSIEMLEQLEISLLTSLNQIRAYKVNHTVQQEMEIQSANQFQDWMRLPFSLALEEQLQPFSWIPSDHSQHMVLSKDPSLLPQRVIGESEGSAGTSLWSYSGFFGSSKKVDMIKFGEEHGFVNELSRTGSLSLQLSEQHNQQMQEQQHQYPSYDFGLLCDQIFSSTELTNGEENTSEYEIDRRFEVPHSANNSSHSIWDSASGTCPLDKFDENLYPQDTSHAWSSTPGNPQGILYNTECIGPHEEGDLF